MVAAEAGVLWGGDKTKRLPSCGLGHAGWGWALGRGGAQAVGPALRPRAAAARAGYSTPALEPRARKISACIYFDQALPQSSTL